jgi:hypothetical protein
MLGSTDFYYLFNGGYVYYIVVDTLPGEAASVREFIKQNVSF